MTIKILAAGDFHKETPRYLRKLVRKHKPDILVSPGDFCQSDYFVEPKNLKKFLKKAHKQGKKTLKYLNTLKIPVYLVFGNHDFYKIPKEDSRRKYKDFREIVKKLENVTFCHKRKIKVGDFKLIGYSGYRNAFLKGLLPKEEYIKEDKKRMKRYKKRFKKHLSKLLKGRDNVILLTHDVPYDTKLDKVRNKESPLDGVHVGDDVFSWALKIFKPVLHICGHMHENQGKIKVKKTFVVNPGFGQERKAAIIDLGKKIKVNFIK